ncbi:MULTISPECIES: non-homologous end-joining DNA ligase [unclassified Streptomyces]|uniref:non-homologous end-joining DNA ligase n=1 Tax=unclassified Streptomyces TaxID=2593676 RepID=UPI002ED16ECD|nr:non-homologous end-joining DNA ligase [Streptomyces sp. NBC_00891]WSY09281.1 non-homologous end-joining DNA ligase [Streptomyces sp. NBC_00890]WSZ10903.1 non-homologous end-joining DNA ligase [Streptomyces sp. NBC_00869]WSZ21593.1 non-homologous end-joining DNA ligase [Streptomyces sp. NBC_00870]
MTTRKIPEISRPEKVLFPDDGITKAGLADYYRTVARRMLPHLRDRPLMLERLPDGIDGHGFMQKDVPDYFPDWVHHVELPKEDGTVTYPIADDTATLVYLAGQACVTPHRFLSRADRPHHPDRMVFDLDPPGDDFAPVREAALGLHGLLDELELPSLVMTTGSRGLHVVVALDRRDDFDGVRAFARAVADALVAREPDRFTTEARKKARGDRLYLDVQRNAYAQTAVAPYAVRARPGAPVAAPLAWEDVDDPDLDARRWTLRDADALLDRDPWHNPPRRRSLGRARTLLDALTA